MQFTMLYYSVAFLDETLFDALIPISISFCVSQDCYPTWIYFATHWIRSYQILAVCWFQLRHKRDQDEWDTDLTQMSLKNCTVIPKARSMGISCKMFLRKRINSQLSLGDVGLTSYTCALAKGLRRAFILWLCFVNLQKEVYSLPCLRICFTIDLFS